MEAPNKTQSTQATPEAHTTEVLNYRNTQDERYDEIIDHMSRCCLCGDELKFHYETDYVLRTVREEAHCHSCGIRNKKESHSIQ